MRNKEAVKITGKSEFLMIKLSSGSVKLSTILKMQL